MIWALFPLIAGAMIILSEEETVEATPSKKRPSPYRFHQRGFFGAPVTVVIGKTGAGKSSFVNMISGSTLPVGHNGSMTRALCGVRYSKNGSDVKCIVDTPGIGEIGTDADYSKALTDWIRSNSSKIERVLLVLQADAKDYASQAALLATIRKITTADIRIVLSQVDKFKPTRATFSKPEWKSLNGSKEPKALFLGEKMKLVAKQFNIPKRSVVPVSCEPDQTFNVAAVHNVISS